MRAWLRSFGYEFRRFPRWLHVFNVLCASALALIASAGLYFLTPLSAARRSYVAGGTLDLPRALSEGELSGALRAELEAFDPASRAAALSALAASCAPGSGRLICEIRAARLGDAELEAAAARRAAALNLSLAELPKALAFGRGARPEGRLAIAREALLFGSEAARTGAFEALLELPGLPALRTISAALEALSWPLHLHHGGARALRAGLDLPADEANLRALLQRARAALSSSAFSLAAERRARARIAAPREPREALELRALLGLASSAPPPAIDAAASDPGALAASARLLCLAAPRGEASLRRLEAALASSNARVRSALLAALRDLPLSSPPATLYALSAAGSTELRGRALLALLAHPEPSNETRARVEALLCDPQEDGLARLALLEQVSRLSPRRAIPLLEAVSHSQSAQIAEVARRFMASLSAP